MSIINHQQYLKLQHHLFRLFYFLLQTFKDPFVSLSTAPGGKSRVTPGQTDDVTLQPLTGTSNVSVISLVTTVTTVSLVSCICKRLDGELSDDERYSVSR